MIKSAIRTAKRLGLSLQEGAMVEATGNCLLEAVRGNIEDREVFSKKIEETVNELRLAAAEEGEKVIGCSPYRIEDFSEEEWAAGWDRLRYEGVWDIDYFGDLMIIALAHFINKNILIINTQQGSPPVTVILGDSLGAPLDSEYPVLLAYSGNHYESLIPVREKDEVVARRIILKYIKGEDLFLDPSEYDSYKPQNYIESRNIEIKREQSPVIQTRTIEIQMGPPEPEIYNWDNTQVRHIKTSVREDSGGSSQPSGGVETWSRYHPLNNTTDSINMWSTTTSPPTPYKSGKPHHQRIRIILFSSYFYFKNQEISTRVSRQHTYDVIRSLLKKHNIIYNTDTHMIVI